jgi:hypothetical protein
MVLATLFAEAEAYRLANRPKAEVVQTPRAPSWARDSWHRFDRKGTSTLDRQSALLRASREEM